MGAFGPQFGRQRGPQFRSIAERARAAALNLVDPATLFAAGELGMWYDVQDLSTMWQDDAGTTAAVVGQPVGRITDKNGNGHTLTQATAANRPILRQNASGHYYLEFDGVDDMLESAAINFTTTNKMTVFAGIRKMSDAASGAVGELSPGYGANDGSFAIFAPTGAADNIAYANRGTSNVAPIATGFAAPVSAVVTGTSDFAASLTTIRVNGALRTSSSAVTGNVNFGNHAFYLGRRSAGTLPFNGHIYSFIARGAATDADTIEGVENTLNEFTKAF